MVAITLREYAQKNGISYEAVRKSVNKYKEELEGHISVQNKTKYLDEEAQKILDEKRRTNPIVVLEEETNEELERLRTELEKRDSKIIELQNLIINMQKEEQVLIESKVRAELLLEEKEKTEAELQDLNEELFEAKMKLGKAEAEANSYKKSIFGLYKKQ